MHSPEQLKRARIMKGYTISQTAKLVGVSRSTYSGYEHGHHKPTSSTLNKIINVLDMYPTKAIDTSRTINAYVIE